MPRSLTTHIDSPREVGFRLKAARERAGLSQRQLAFPGCTAAYISRLEAGARVPSLQMVNQLALRLEVTGQWLPAGGGAAPVLANGEPARASPGVHGPVARDGRRSRCGPAVRADRRRGRTPPR